MRAFPSLAIAALLLAGCSKPEESLKSEVEVVKGPLSLQFMASKTVYDYGESMNFELSMTNDSHDTLSIDLPYISGPTFEMEILSQTGEVVWARYDDGAPLLLGATVSMFPGDVYRWCVTAFDTLDADRYTAIGWPVCDRQFMARIGFRVRQER